MRRFFVERIQENKPVCIRDADARHISKALRLKPGEHIAVVTADGEEYDVVLDEVGAGMVQGSVVEVRAGTGDPALKVILVQGLPKGDKLELIIQKCTELGIAEIWPVHTERSVVRLAASKIEQRRERWQRIALEAAKQCKRRRVPLVKTLQNWPSVLRNMAGNFQGILLWENEDTISLKAALSGMNCNDPVYIFVGPEGGLTVEEVHAAQARGIGTVSLGPRILRTETAGLAALSIVMYQLGDLGGGRMTCGK